MMPSVTIELTPESRAKLDSLQRMTLRVMQAIRKAHDAVNERTVKHIALRRMSADKFQPPLAPYRGILRTKSNFLRDTLRENKAVVEGTQVISSIGSNVKYAGVHEFGFSGTQHVEAHRSTIFRRLSATGKPLKRKRMTGYTIVRSHDRQMRIPARQPIYRGIMDCVQDYTDTISKAIVDAI